MKIVHVVTLASQDGAFGGPLSVALVQCEALASAGHDVTLVAGWDGRAGLDVPGVNVSLVRVRPFVPRTGFAGLWSPKLTRVLRKAMRDADVVHVHLARDLVGATAVHVATRRGVRIVVQTHGMMMADPRFRSRVFDRAFYVGLPSKVSTAFTLTSDETRQLEKLGFSGRQLTPINNAIQIPDDRPTTPVSDRERREVLFLSRLHARKRPMVFLDIAERLLGSGVDADFVLVGADGGELDAVLARVATSRFADRIRYEGAVAPGEGPARIGKADVFVLPSVGEIVPMAVLEALSVGTPVVLTEDCGLAEALADDDAAIVTGTSPDEIARAVRLLLRDSERRSELSANGARSVSARFSPHSVGRELERRYSRPIARATVTLIQPYVPRYRVPLFDSLSAELAKSGIELTVLAGRPSGAQAERRDDSQSHPWLRQSPVHLAGRRAGRAHWSRSRALWKKDDLVVALAQATRLDTWQVLFRRNSGRSSAIWGHIDAYVTERSWLRSALMSVMVRRAGHTFAYTPSGAKRAIELGARRDRVSAFMNTVDTAELSAAIAGFGPRGRAEYRAKIGVGDSPLFAYIGALDAEKRIDFLANALEELWLQDPNARVCIVGEGADAPLLDKAVERGQAIMLGHVAGHYKAPLLASADAILNPGRIGLLAVDAIVARLPIVTTPWDRHGPEFEYLVDGQSVVVALSDARQYAACALEVARGSHARNFGQPPTIADTTERVATVLTNLAMRDATEATREVPPQNAPWKE